MAKISAMMSVSVGAAMPGGEDIEVNKPKVFVIDDDHGIRGALTFALELEGFSVAAFARGADLLSERTLPQSGCLVIDYKLSDMTGLELLEHLRRRDVRLPAILITSAPTQSLRRRAAAIGLQIVEKPLLGEQLLDAIRDSVAAEERRIH